MDPHPLTPILSHMARHSFKDYWRVPKPGDALVVNHDTHRDSRYVREGWELCACPHRIILQPRVLRWQEQWSSHEAHQELRAEFEIPSGQVSKLSLSTWCADESRCYTLHIHPLSGQTCYELYLDCRSLEDRGNCPVPASELAEYIEELSARMLPRFLRESILLR